MYWWIVQHLIVVTALATLVLVAGRVFRLSPAVRHALWVVVLIKLMMPPVIVWPWAMPQYAPAALSAPGTTTIVDVSEIALEPDDVAVPLAKTGPEAAVSSSAATVSALRWTTENHRSLVLGLWCAGSVIVAGIHFGRIARYRRYVAKRQEVPQWIVDETRAIADRLGVAAPATYAVHGLHSPLVHHFGRAVLLIPRALLDLIPRERWQCILAHELAHLRRGDHVVRWLELIAAIVWWWNPVLWLVQRNLHESAEEACDAYVVWALPNSRRVYAETLIDVSELISRKEVQVTALGIRNGVRMDFERRLEHILHGTFMPRLGFTALITLALILGLTLPAWTQSDAAITPPAATAPAAEPAPALPAPATASAPETAKPEPPASGPHEKTALEIALDAPVNLEFQDTHVADICEFTAEYVGINVVLDFRFIQPKSHARPAGASADAASGTGPEQRAPEYVPAAKYVTDGMVPYLQLKDIPLKDALQALLAPLELTYEVHPEFLWITAKTQLGKDDFSNPVPAGAEVNRVLDASVSIEFQDEHLVNISEFISEYLGVNIVVDKRAVRAPMPAPQPTLSQDPPVPIKDGDRVVCTGYVPYIKMDDVSAREAIKALLVPLGLYYKLGPGFVFISTPELLKTTEFAPSKQEEKAEAKIPAADKSNQDAAKPVESTPEARVERDERMKHEMETLTLAVGIDTLKKAQAELEEDNDKQALASFREAIAVFSQEGVESKEQKDGAQRMVNRIINRALDEAQDKLDEGDRQLASNEFEPALAAFKGVSAVLDIVPADAHQKQREQKSKLIELSLNKLVEIEKVKRAWEEAQKRQ